jgi:5'-nucleotidase
MKILITNDDGINSKGIIALARRFKEMGEVIVVAPNKQMSATSHSITTNRPLRYKKYYIENEFFGYALDGTPADCVKFAVLSLLEKQKPDIVLSGINYGRNTGINIMYSGTIAGATEGHLLKVPSFAISLSSHNTELESETAADYAFKIITEVLKQDNKENLFLNINVPAIPTDQIKGVKVVSNSKSY